MNYTKNNQKMTFLFAGIIGMMMLSFGTMSDVFAQSEPGGEDLAGIGSVGVS